MESEVCSNADSEVLCSLRRRHTLYSLESSLQGATQSLHQILSPSEFSAVVRSPVQNLY